MAPHPTVHQSKRGFTLLELLLATVVASLVLLAIQTVFFGALRLRNTTSDKIEQDLELERAIGIMERDFAGLMLPGNTIGGELQSIPSTSMDEDQVGGDRVTPDLYTTTGKVDLRTPFSEVQKVAYYLLPAEDGGEGKVLVRAITRNLLPIDIGEVEKQALLEGVEEMFIEFYDGTQWLDTWDTTITDTLPRAIRYQITLVGRSDDAIKPTPIENIIPVLPMTQTSLTEATSSNSMSGLPGGGR